MIKLFVGLGNPGPQYQDTRHNVGFWWIQELARKMGLNWQEEKAYKALLCKTRHQGQAIWLLQPQTFMNLSGFSVGALARFHKIAPEELLVVHDELDLPPGRVKLKQGGGHAGHNGLKDIDAQLGNPNYWRLRIGIGHPGIKAEVANWVLKKPSPDQNLAMQQAMSHSLQAAPAFLQGDMQAATQHIHRLPTSNSGSSSAITTPIAPR